MKITIRRSLPLLKEVELRFLGCRDYVVDDALRERPAVPTRAAVFAFGARLVIGDGDNPGTDVDPVPVHVGDLARPEAESASNDHDEARDLPVPRVVDPFDGLQKPLIFALGQRAFFRVSDHQEQPPDC